MEYNVKPVCVECGSTSPQFCDACRPPPPDLGAMLAELQKPICEGKADKFATQYRFGWNDALSAVEAALAER